MEMNKESKMADINVEELLNMKLKELKDYAKKIDVKLSETKKENIVYEILEKNAAKDGKFIGSGRLDILPDGYGFLRESSVEKDIYISASQIKKFSLRVDDIIFSEIRNPIQSEGNFAVIKIYTVNGESLEKSQERQKFEELTPYYPTERLILENSKADDSVSGRIIDLIAPIGKGQRGLIVAPPKAGKTMLISQMANNIMENHPEAIVWIVLIDERPEEVTDIKENVLGAKVFASTFDENPMNHIKVTEQVIERAKRMVEEKKDVIILMDSITRLARSYNIVMPSSGKVISGGIDPGALHLPKKFFGAARNIKDKNGVKQGSLTILATALVDTGSKMDEVIYEEFKGTGNMEIHLDRQLAELRIYPAIDVKRSGTRREELLLSKNELNAVWKIRRELAKKHITVATQELIEGIKKTKSNKVLTDLFEKGDSNGK